MKAKRRGRPPGKVNRSAIRKLIRELLKEEIEVIKPAYVTVRFKHTEEKEYTYLARKGHGLVEGQTVMTPTGPAKVVNPDARANAEMGPDFRAYKWLVGKVVPI